MPNQTPNRFNAVRLIAGPEGFTFYDSGRQKLHIFACDIAIRPGQPPIFQIALPCGPIDVVGSPMFALVDPDSGRPRMVKRIEWADGQSTDFPVAALPENVVRENVVPGTNGGGENVVRQPEPAPEVAP